MKHYKFISEYYIEEYTNPYVYVGGIQVSYPSPEVLLMAGIKPLVVEEMPEYNEETQYVMQYYVDRETEITQKWNVYDIPTDYEVMDDEPVTDA